MDTLPDAGDFFNRRETLSSCAPVPGPPRRYRPRALNRISTAAEMAALVLSRRHRLTRQRAALLADLAGLGREALS